MATDETTITVDELSEFIEFRKELEGIYTKITDDIMTEHKEAIGMSFKNLIKYIPDDLQRRIKKLVHLKGLYELLIRGSVKTIDDALSHNDVKVVDNILKDIDKLSSEPTVPVIATHEQIPPVTTVTTVSTHITTTTMVLTTTTPAQRPTVVDDEDDNLGQALKERDNKILMEFKLLHRNNMFSFPEEKYEDYDSERDDADSDV